MKALVCELCGSNELIKQDGAFVCQHCGTKYSVEEAKKMMIEGSVDVSGSTVKVDTSSELKNLYELARRAKSDNNSENAQKYYDQILVKDPSSWEANFYSVYYQSMNCKIAQIQNAAVRLQNCEATVLELIKENVTDSEEQRQAVDEVGARLIRIARMLFNAAKNHYDGIGASIQGKYTQQMVNNCCASRGILYKYGDNLITFFGETYGTIAAACWKVGIEMHNSLMPYFADKDANKNAILKNVELVKKYDESYQAPSINTSSGGCYVATAVYGSYDCPQVWTLRRFRDDILAASWYGRAFIRTYYAISPTLVKWFGKTEWFKNMWKPSLDRMVERLNKEGFKDTPYNDRRW